MTFKFGAKYANVFDRIASQPWWTLLTVVKDGCNSANCFQGSFAEMFLLLQSKLNFTFKVAREHSFGIEEENGSWTGMIGALISYSQI